MPDREVLQHVNGNGRRWWDTEVGYEVYIRSFADGNDDGVGDLPGLTGRLDHLAWLGVGIVWITPFYPSPMRDFGYDVADYTGVDPLFGTLEDFDACIAEAKRLGLRVLVDLVPNHTSDQHRWFQASRADPDGPLRGFYHWRDPAPGGGPPNNWVSHFGGPAWTYDELSGQYYLHLFLPEQPDLNWANPNLVREFDQVLLFWLDRGVDGFRVDVAHGLVKNMLMPDNPQRFPVTPEMSPRQMFDCYEHRYDLDQAGNAAIYRRWRAIVQDYDAMLLGEVYLRDNNPNRVSRYVANQDGLHRAFYFAPMHTPWDSSAMWSTFRDALDAAPQDLSWATSSHDDPRAPTRLGGGELGRMRALSYSVLLFALPGLPFLYQGDELGLTDVEVPPDCQRDPVAVRNRNPADGRDGCRTPMPWEPGPKGGFTAGQEPWLPLGRADADTVAIQRDDPGSILHKYRELLAVRRELEDLHTGGLGAKGDTPRTVRLTRDDPHTGELGSKGLGAGDSDNGIPPASAPTAKGLEWLTDRSVPVISFRRGDCVCALNMADIPTELRLPPGQWQLAFSSRQTAGAVFKSAISLDSPEGVLLVRMPEEG